MKFSNILCSISLGVLIACGTVRASGSPRLDVYHKVAENETLTLLGFQSFVDNVMGNLSCEATTQQGQRTCTTRMMCVNVTDLASTAVSLATPGVLSESEFEDLCVIILDLITSVEDSDLCHKDVDTSTLSVSASTTRLLNSTFGVGLVATVIPPSATIDVLDELEHHKEEDHDDHDDDHDHDHDDDHDHDHDDDHDHDHDDDHDDHDHHDHDDHSEEELLAETAELVLAQKCLSQSVLNYYMGLDKGDNISVSSLPQLAGLLTYMISNGSHIEHECRLLLEPEELFMAIFNEYGGSEGTIDPAGMTSLMAKMGIGEDAGGEEGHDEHEGHDHRRKKRSLNSQLVNLLRTKRSAGHDDHDDDHSDPLATCYSAAQLMALHDSLDKVDQAAFRDMCPSLVSQSLFADCAHEDEHSGGDMTDAQIYGYGSIAVFIICASSFVGMLFLPFVSDKVYRVLMAVFIGLAMGTLFADAVLHLLPMATGQHVHGHGHDHGSGEIVVEEHVRIGLCIMFCLYGFYLLEVFISNYGGHSHTKTGDHDDEFKPSDFFEGNGKANGNSVGIGGTKEAWNSESKPEAKLESAGCWKEITTMPPLALMVVLGDAVHNFADGLAVAAAFSVSVTSGVATTIAIFCHEVPHELGDFAVLLQSGCSFKKAFLLNLVSALTAFIGLYVGIQVATSERTQSYIFAAAAAMFIYISLVDLLPEIIRTKKGSLIILNNVGILIGFTILFVIAITEEHIKI